MLSDIKKKKKSSDGRETNTHIANIITTQKKEKKQDSCAKKLETHRQDKEREKETKRPEIFRLRLLCFLTVEEELTMSQKRVNRKKKTFVSKKRE